MPGSCKNKILDEMLIKYGKLGSKILVLQFNGLPSVKLDLKKLETLMSITTGSNSNYLSCNFLLGTDRYYIIACLMKKINIILC